MYMLRDSMKGGDGIGVEFKGQVLMRPHVEVRLCAM